jgi:hypothetical protein
MSPKPATPHLDKVPLYCEFDGSVGSGSGTCMDSDDVRAAYEADLLADRATFEAAVRADERRLCMLDASGRAISCLCAILAGGSRERVVVEVLQGLRDYFTERGVKP